MDAAVENFDEHDYEVVQAGFDRSSLRLTCAVHCASRVLWPQRPRRRAIQRPSQQPGTSSAGETVATGIAADCCTDRVVSGRFGVADPGRFDVSNADCRGGTLDAKTFQSEG